MRHLHRLAAVLVAGTIVVTTPGAAAAAPDDRSAGWLERQLTDGLVHNDQYDTDDYGLSADTAYALAAIGGRGESVRQISDALAAEVESFISYSYDFEGSQYEGRIAGATAKSLVLAQISQAGARDFGRLNLVQRLDQLVLANGRIADDATVDGEPDPAGDYANTIGQAFAARGLSRAGSGKADDVVRFLLKQQCRAGFFRLNFAAKDAPKQGCDAGSAADSSPDTDVTALAVLQLDALPKQARTKAVKRALDDATTWLKKKQKRNGSLGGGTSTQASNTNSTGLAAWALGETGSCKKARAAARWVRDLQVSGDVSGTPLAGQKGAIAYDRAAYEAAEADGITSADQDQWRRATTQAAPGLRHLTCG
ncbi:MAG: hypothetical protein ACXWXO_19935 [Nocardioides sp.]